MPTACSSGSTPTSWTGSSRRGSRSPSTCSSGGSSSRSSSSRPAGRKLAASRVGGTRRGASQALERTVLAPAGSSEGEESVCGVPSRPPATRLPPIPPSFADLYGAEVETSRRRPEAAPPEPTPESPLLGRLLAQGSSATRRLELGSTVTINKSGVATFTVVVEPPGEEPVDARSTLGLARSRSGSSSPLSSTGRGAARRSATSAWPDPTADEVLTDLGREMWEATFGRGIELADSLLGAGEARTASASSRTLPTAASPRCPGRRSCSPSTPSSSARTSGCR